ncbi:MAG: hypothetical protein ACOZE5_16525 [Verrucomicrobiota bacterium]
MRNRPDTRPVRVRQPHRYEWLWEPLTEDATFVLRSMFGAKAAYLDGKLMLCFCAGQEPWRGVLVCTGREHQASLRTDFPELSPHPVLPKWLYLPESAGRFEACAARLVALARRRDPRLGVVPKTKRRSGARHRRP